LIAFVLCRDDAIVKLLLARNDVDVNLKDGGGWSPLFYAIGKGDDAIVKVLLSRDDVDVNSKDQKSWSSLSYAIARDMLQSKLLHCP
jgi:ankyrin repeat protein